MVAFLRHGAQYVLASKEGDIKDEDIDAILAKGEAKVCATFFQIYFS